MSSCSGVFLLRHFRLETAFEYKTNVLPGETMPDPRTDDSFRELLKNKEIP